MHKKMGFEKSKLLLRMFTAKERHLESISIISLPIQFNGVYV